MTLTKKKMISEIGRRTRLKNRDVQAMLEALVEVWTGELVNGGRIELEKFMVLEVKEIDRGFEPGDLIREGQLYSAPRYIHKVVLRVSKKLKGSLKTK
jgi:nucleoid DNA-binding protein